MTEKDVLERIEYFLQLKHWTLYRLAKESGLPYSSLNNLFHRNTCPTIPTLSKICNGLQITLGDFFNDVTPTTPHSSLTEEQQSLLNQIEVLSKKDRELLQAYLKGLSKH